MSTSVPRESVAILLLMGGAAVFMPKEVSIYMIAVIVALAGAWFLYRTILAKRPDMASPILDALWLKHGKKRGLEFGPIMSKESLTTVQATVQKMKELMVR